MRTLLVVLMVPVIVFGCKSKEKRPYPWRHTETTTPAGYRAAWVDEGSPYDAAVAEQIARQPSAEIGPTDNAATKAESSSGSKPTHQPPRTNSGGVEIPL